MLVLHHQVKTSVNLKFQISIINKDPSQLVPQSTEGDFRDLWPLINMIIMSSHDMSPASKYSPSQLREWPRRRRRYGHGNMSVKAPLPFTIIFPRFLLKNALKLCFLPKRTPAFGQKSYGFGGLVWWMSGVVDVRCGGCLVWWMSFSTHGVMDVWCGGYLVWWISYNQKYPWIHNHFFYKIIGLFSI